MKVSPVPILSLGFLIALLTVLTFDANINHTYSSPTPQVLVNHLSDKSISLGTNLSSIADWSTQLPFLDAFKSSRKWITQCKAKEPNCKGSWNTNEYDKLDLDEHGWVKSLPDPEDSPEYTRVSTLLLREIDRYPGGQYVVLYDGEGTIEYGFDGQKDEGASRLGRDVITVNPSNAGILLTITATDPNRTGNYIRNICVVEAKYEDTYQSEIFNPDFLDRIEKFRALRFMGWMKTNNSQQNEWSNRPKVDDVSYAIKGAPIEIMVELANRLQVDPWFNIPHMATDEYITNFAKLIKDSLDPNLTIYVEYSNEVWNPQFKQFHWVRDNGAIPGGKTPYQSYGVRTAQMCDIWKGVFGEESNQVKCVMGTQTANPWVASQVLNCDQWEAYPCYKHGIDALAITGYFSGGFGKPEYEQAIESWLEDPNVDEFEPAITQLKNGSVFDEESYSVKGLREKFDQHANIVQEKSLELVIYEGGSHILGRKGVENNERLTKFFIELHRRPEFYDMYTQMLKTWKNTNENRTLFMNFTDISKPSKWGSWGVLEHVDQDSSPRYDALMDFIDSNTSVSIPGNSQG